MKFADYVKSLIDYAKRRGINPKSVLMLAGINVTHTYTHKSIKRPQRGSQGRYDII